MTETQIPEIKNVMDGYRSESIGQIVAARAKSTAAIKKIVKDRYVDAGKVKYSYAELSDVMDAVDDALAAQELAIFQTLQERGNRTVLITTLAHSSGESISSEIGVSSSGAGPQVFGSSLTYMRRYSILGILGLAPDRDDDGQAAQQFAQRDRRQPPPPQAPARMPGQHQGQGNPPPSGVPSDREAQKPFNPEAFKAFLQEKLDVADDLDKLDELWKGGMSARIRDIGVSDKKLQNECITLFSERKAKLLKKLEHDAKVAIEGEINEDAEPVDASEPPALPPRPAPPAGRPPRQSH